jgi:hypothetical protein
MIINENPSSHFREAKLKLQKHIKFLMIAKLKLTDFYQKKLKKLRNHEPTCQVSDDDQKN